MAKVANFGDDENPAWMFYCPGCDVSHCFDKRWTFNGDVEKPTFTPSLLIDKLTKNDTQARCHSFVTDGQIRYLSDCEHGMKGKTITIPDWSEDKFK